MDNESRPTEVDSEPEATNTRHQGPYGTRHPIPTVQHYKQIRQERDQLDESNDQGHEQGRKRDGLKKIFKLGNDSNKGDTKAQGWADQGYSRNQAATGAERRVANAGDESADSHGEADAINGDQDADQADTDGDGSGGEMPVDTSEAISNEADPRKKRKAMKGRTPEKDKKSRKVTDPITHLPVTIHDFTDKELNDAPANFPSFGSQPRTATGASAEDKDEKQLKSEGNEIEKGTKGTRALFPPPSFGALRAEIGGAYVTVFAVCVSSIAFTAFLSLGTMFWLSDHKDWSSTRLRFIEAAILCAGMSLSALSIWVSKGWLTSKLGAIWQDNVWEAARLQERKEQRKLQIPESAMWLNSVVASIWPLINPDLFSSMVDTLEDVMQASLPKVVRMIAIEDFGQGKSALRILGVRWLPSGAAAQSVSKEGKLKPQDKGKSDRENPDKGTVKSDEQSKDDPNKEDPKEEESEETSLAEGLEAESGDFMNMELSFSYRATAKGKSLKEKTENAHMYLVFYLPASMAILLYIACQWLTTLRSAGSRMGGNRRTCRNHATSHSNRARPSFHQALHTKLHGSAKGQHILRTSCEAGPKYYGSTPHQLVRTV